MTHGLQSLSNSALDLLNQAASISLTLWHRLLMSNFSGVTS